MTLGEPTARVAIDSMVAEKAEAPGEFVVVRCDHAAFAGRDVLDRVETEYRHVGDTADAAAFVQGTRSVAGVFDHGESVRLGKRHDFVEIGGMASVVDGEHRPGPTGDSPCDLGRIYRERVGMNISEHGRCTLIQHTVGRSAEGEWRGDCFIPESKSRSEGGGVERRRSGGEADGVIRANACSKRLLKLRDFGPGGDPVRAEDLADGLNVVLVNLLTPIRQQRGPNRLAAVNRQCLTCRYGLHR